MGRPSMTPMRFCLAVALAELSGQSQLRGQPIKGEGFAQLDSVEERLNKFQQELKSMGVAVQAPDVAEPSSLLQTSDPDHKYDPGNLKLDEARAKAKEETNELRRTIDQDAADFDKADHVVASQESSLLQTGAKELPRELEMDDATKQMQRDTKSLKHTDDVKLRKFLQDQQAFEHSEEADASSLLEKHAAARGKHQAKRKAAAHQRFEVPRGVANAEERLAAVEAQIRRLDGQFRQQMDASSFVQEDPPAQAQPQDPPQEPQDDALAAFNRETDALSKIDLAGDAQHLQDGLAMAANSLQGSSLLERKAAIKNKGKAKNLDDLDYGNGALTGEVEGLGTVDVSDLVDRAGSYLQGAPKEQPLDPLTEATKGGAQLARDLLAMRDAKLAQVPAPGSILAQAFETPDGKTRPLNQW